MISSNFILVFATLRVKGCPQGDVNMFLDTSISVTDNLRKQYKDFITGIIKKLDNGAGDYRFGIQYFSHNVYTIAGLENYNKRDTIAALESANISRSHRHSAAVTHFNEAFEYLLSFFGEPTNRARILLVFSDGKIDSTEFSTMYRVHANLKKWKIEAITLFFLDHSRYRPDGITLTLGRELGTRGFFTFKKDWAGNYYLNHDKVIDLVANAINTACWTYHGKSPPRDQLFNAPMCAHIIDGNEIKYNASGNCEGVKQRECIDSTKRMVANDGIDNDCDGKIDEEDANLKDDDKDGRIDEDTAQGEAQVCVNTVSNMVEGDGIDNDCDGRVDEEILNEQDEDGDGLIDEDNQFGSWSAENEEGGGAKKQKKKGFIKGYLRWLLIAAGAIVVLGVVSVCFRKCKSDDDDSS